MPGRRSDDTDVTLGEVYRLVQAVKEEHGIKLDAIDTQVRITNGRTTTLETKVEGLQRDVHGLKPPPPQTPPGLPVMTPDGESLSIRISPKMWAVIAAIASSLYIFVPIAAKWLEAFLGAK